MQKTITRMLQNLFMKMIITSLTKRVKNKQVHWESFTSKNVIFQKMRTQGLSKADTGRMVQKIVWIVTPRPQTVGDPKQKEA